MHTHAVSLVASDTQVDFGVKDADLATPVMISEHHHPHTAAVKLGRDPSLGGNQLSGPPLLRTMYSKWMGTHTHAHKQG